MNKWDRFETAIWVSLVCTIVGVGLAAAEYSAAGGLIALAGVGYLCWTLPLDFKPPRRPEPEVIEVHHHVTTTNFYQLPKYDRVTEGVQVDVRAGKFTRLIRWE